MHRGPYRHKPIEERPTVKLWQRYQGKRCGHPRLQLNCKHCIAAATIEAHWNKQRSAS